MTPALLALALALIAGNGFFVGAEFAVLAARRSRLEPLARSSRRARNALRAIEQLPLMISGCQFGITLCSLGLGALGEPAVAGLLNGPLAAAHLPHELLHPVALVAALTLVSALHMLLGEMVPKNLALAGPERAALALAPPLLGFVRLFLPVLVSLTATANGVLRMLRIQPVSEIGDANTRDAVASLIGESREEGLLGGEQHELLTGALAFEERTVANVMLSLEATVTVAADITPAQVEELVARTGYSRFPVRGKDPTPSTARMASLLGYLHLSDLLEVDPVARRRPVAATCIRPLVSVAVSDPLTTALVALQRTGAHLGQVLDTDGATLGVLALEDVLEELVGEVRDATRRRPAT